jgi:hypothetical protein
MLVVSSKGGVFVTGDMWGAARWVQYHHVVALGQREELTEKERARQRREVERFQAKRKQWRQKAGELYNFVWDELEDGEGCMLETLQTKARARGLRASAKTWWRIGQVLGYDGKAQFWKMPRRLARSTIVMPSAMRPDCRPPLHPPPLMKGGLKTVELSGFKAGCCR